MAEAWIQESSYSPDNRGTRLPEDPDAERSLLATCAAPGNEPLAAEVLYTLSAEDFVHPAHGAIFKALLRLLEARLEVNSLTLRDVLEQEGELGKVGGYAGLLEILGAEEVGRPSVLADLLRRKRKLRQLIRIGTHVARQAAEEEKGPDLLVEEAAADLYRLAQGEGRHRGLDHIAKVGTEASQRILDRLNGRDTSGMRVHFSRLDQLTQGFQPGNLIILAARPGIGKTALALNWLLRAARFENAHGAFFSLEMSNEEVFSRLLSAHARVNMKLVQAGQFDAQMEAQLWRSRDELINLPIFINDQASVTVPQITAMVDRHLSQSNQKLDILFIDYLQLMQSPSGSRAAQQNEATRVGEISRGLKLLAKEHGIPVVVLSQLNRQVEQGQGRKPQLSDLRDSGAIEQDADIVMFIHRKMRPMLDGEEVDRNAELLISKHRNGPTASIPLIFEGEYATYHEMERDTGIGA
jgi:replicative DNA helicase